MIDETGHKQAMYHWQQNDCFDLLGILQSREFVAQIPGDVSMEALVDWGARLKDAAAMVDGKVVQVLFDNLDTGRVSQLQGLPVMQQFASSTSDSSESLSRDEDESSISPTGTSTSATNDLDIPSASGRLTPYDCAGKLRQERDESPPLHGRNDGEDFWAYRQRILRPLSPSRHYRPGEKGKKHRGGKVKRLRSS
jgi:hypothetical protein